MPNPSTAVDLKTAADLIGIGRTKLCKYLKENGYTKPNEFNQNSPSPIYTQQGLFKIELGSHQRGQVTRVHEKTLVTAKGIQVLREQINQ